MAWGSASLKPTALSEIPHGHQGACQHQTDGVRIAPGEVELGHELKIHAINAGNQSRGKQCDTCHGENLDDFILIDVDETNGCIHQEVDLVKQESCVVVQGFDVAQDLACFFELI